MRKFLGIAAIAALSSSCASVSSLSTGKTLPEGKGRFLIGGGTTTMTAGTESLTLPMLELMYRHGITERFELGAKLTLPYSPTIDAKYGLIQGEGFNLAAGLAAGYAGYSITSGSTTAKVTIVDLTLPVYASYHLNDWFALYLVPKFFQRIASVSVTGSGSVSTASASGSMVGATGGFQLGNSWGLAAEYSYLKYLGSTGGNSQVAAALFFGGGRASGGGSTPAN